MFGVSGVYGFSCVGMTSTKTASLPANLEDAVEDEESIVKSNPKP